jgi:outer membrane protein OmpA-like peptidoglycan-associated protein
MSMQLDEEELEPPIWPAFGDLMACLFGLFVLFFVWMVMTQVMLDRELGAERVRLATARARVSSLESALAGPLSSGLITLIDGRIGIRGAVLFDSSEAELKPEGSRLLRELVPPLNAFLKQNDVALMVSGFTDDRSFRRNARFLDNWELSTQRALTVTRALAQAGVPPRTLIAAGFAELQPIVPNDSDAHRAQNRRVEIAPIPRPKSWRAATATPDPAP